MYTGHIEKFHPNTPHSLLVEALAYYHLRATGERHILRRLREYNYTTDGNQLYYQGNVGIHGAFLSTRVCSNVHGIPPKGLHTSI